MRYSLGTSRNREVKLTTRSGQPCEHCSGHLIVYCSRRRAGNQIQYLRCIACGKRPNDNKIVVPAEAIRRRMRVPM